MKAKKDELLTIPGIGRRMAGDLRKLGVSSILDLSAKDPEGLYDELCDLTQSKQDPCVLYTFRCAVYYARNPKPKPGVAEVVGLERQEA